MDNEMKNTDFEYEKMAHSKKSKYAELIENTKPYEIKGIKKWRKSESK